MSAPPMPWNAVKKLKVRKVVEAGSTLRVHHVQEHGTCHVSQLTSRSTGYTEVLVYRLWMRSMMPLSDLGSLLPSLRPSN